MKIFLIVLTLFLGVSGVVLRVSDSPLPGQRCKGKLLSEEKLKKNCCSPSEPCGEGEGDCDTDKNDGCKPGLRCGNNNCLQYGTYYHKKDDCCEKDPSLQLDPPEGQRCSGRNYGSKRCCTPEEPCEEGEGDCDGPGDGGKHDGHDGCKGDLICGSNNCLQFGIYFHPKDDCCEKNKTKESKYETVIVTPQNLTDRISVKERIRDPNPTLPLDKPDSQRCGGRNYEEKGSCCTVETPCGLGEGDCEPKSDGSGSNNHTDCMAGLVCGSNNCLKFGLFYHEKDDCCDYPKQTYVDQACAFLGIGC